ncbi:MAG: prepilin-type N-terminal cleavage/methylation domain-containing protein [Acidobacteriota bacterium]|nr:prepilin-type N-terminal cleavage/methylation domain-containing protein [Acidobacteriota bacterium]
MKLTSKLKTEASTVTIGVGKRSPRTTCVPGDEGFTLLETMIALVVMMIAALGAASVFSYSINYNSGGSDRLVALAIAQEQLERIRSGHFNSTTTDTILEGGVSVRGGIIRNGKRYVLTTTIDDDPTTLLPDIIAGTSLKRITVAVAPENVSQGWSLNAGARITLITQRARSDR